jgi:hypothetical protein
MLLVIAIALSSQNITSVVFTMRVMFPVLRQTWVVEDGEVFKSALHFPNNGKLMWHLSRRTVTG